MAELKPNVIWIMCDQLRAQAVGINGDPNVRTPNIDLLARTGLNFRNAIGGSPLCSPYRGSMLTSLYPHKCVPGHEHLLPPAQSTIADVFREHGYHTAYIGKWHLDGFHERDGRAGTHYIPKERRGHFDYWMGYENNNSQWDCWVHGGDRDGETPPYRLNGYETDELTSLFLRHLDGRPDGEPFFGVLSVQPPHDPYIAPPEYMRRHSPASIAMRPNVPGVPYVMEQARRELSGAYAMIENLDDNVGRVVAYLRDKGLYEHTHILFFSDHGDMHGSHGMFRKTNPYEESLKVPFIISGCRPTYDGWKNGAPDYPINHVDVAPTSLGLCGIEPPTWMQGADYSALRFRSNRKADYPDSAYAQIVVPTGHSDSEEMPWRAVVTRDGWKYAAFEHMPWLMYNLNDDPYEQVNLAHNTAFGTKRTELQARLKRWIDETGDEFAL